MKGQAFTFALFFLVSFFINPLPAKTLSLQEQRTLYTRATFALEKQQTQHAKNLMAKLTDYPLYPYLEYKLHQDNLDAITFKDIQTFSQKYPNSPLTFKLEKKWMLNLIVRKRWEDYLFHFKDTHKKDLVLQCYYLWSNIQLNEYDVIKDQVVSLWFSPQQLPKTCDYVLDYWKAQGGLTSTYLWQRIYLAAQAKQVDVLNKLKSSLPKNEQHYIDLWVSINNTPSQLLKVKHWNWQHPFTAHIVKNGLKRLLEQDERAFIEHWPHVEKNYPLSQEDYYDIKSFVGVLFAVRKHPDALTWLESIPDDYITSKAREWRIRVYLYQKDWAKVTYWIKKLTELEQNTSQWQYWLARSLEAQNKTSTSQSMYRLLAYKMDYYGLLAKKRLTKQNSDSGYSLNISQKEIQQLLQEQPEIKRANELKHLQKIREAKEEWDAALLTLSPKEKYIAGEIALEWQWYDRAILLGKQDMFEHHYRIKYPLVNYDLFIKHANEHNINPSFIYAITHQESEFKQDAKSPAGALGLMQLMPKTASYLAKEEKLGNINATHLLQANHNIKLGTLYFKKMMRVFKHPALAAAAYNAGPEAVKRWLSPFDDIEADIWIETIPYYETRHYVKKVMTNCIAYDLHLEQSSSIDSWTSAIMSADTLFR